MLYFVTTISSGTDTDLSSIFIHLVDKKRMQKKRKQSERRRKKGKEESWQKKEIQGCASCDGSTTPGKVVINVPSGVQVGNLNVGGRGIYSFLISYKNFISYILYRIRINNKITNGSKIYFLENIIYKKY